VQHRVFLGVKQDILRLHRPYKGQEMIFQVCSIAQLLVLR
jgi:hypothetical protein